MISQHIFSPLQAPWVPSVRVSAPPITLARTWPHVGTQSAAVSRVTAVSCSLVGIARTSCSSARRSGGGIRCAARARITVRLTTVLIRTVTIGPANARARLDSLL